jgi:hypothetical protein
MSPLICWYSGLKAGVKPPKPDTSAPNMGEDVGLLNKGEGRVDIKVEPKNEGRQVVLKL